MSHRHRYRLALYQNHPIDSHIVDYLEGIDDGMRQEMLRILLRAGFAIFNEGNHEKARLLLAGGAGGGAAPAASSPAPIPAPSVPRVPPNTPPEDLPSNPGPVPVPPPQKHEESMGGGNVPTLTHEVGKDVDTNRDKVPTPNSESVKSTTVEEEGISSSHEDPISADQVNQPSFSEEPPQLSDFDDAEGLDDDDVIDGLMLVSEKVGRQ